MVDERAVQEGLKEWLENPHWAGYYNNAPSDKCKAYIAMDFHYSDTEDEEVAEAMDRIGDTLSIQDWSYIYKNTTGPGKAAIAKRIAELES